MEIKEKNPPPLTRPKRLLDNFITCRRVLNIMVFLGFMVNYMLRVNLTFAIVDMVPKKHDSKHTNITTTPTLLNLSSALDGSNLTRVIRSPSDSEFSALLEGDDENEDEDKGEEEARNRRKNNLRGTNVIAPNSGFSANVSGGFQSFGSISSNLNQVKNSSSGNQPIGFQSFGSAFGGNQSGGFSSISSSSGGNQSGRFQLSSQSGGKTLISTGLSEPFYSDASAIQQTNVTGDDGNLSSQKIDLSPNSLDDFNAGDSISKDSRILYSENTDKKPLEVRNAKLDQESQISSTPAPIKENIQKPGVRRFDWSEAAQEHLIGAFFWGYILTELPGGRLAEVIGARKVFGYATLGASVVTLLTPMFAKIHYIMILINRITLGLFLGPTWPSILPLASKWIPMDERGKFLSNMMASTLGAGFTLPMCGYIIETFSWEYVFYTTGLLGFIWSVLWFLVVFETPADHPRITPEERLYIESNLNVQPSKSPANNYSIEEKQVAQGLMVHSGDESCLSDNEHEQKSSDECRNYSTFTRNGNVTNSNSDIKGSSKDAKSSTDRSNSKANDTKIMAVSNITNGDVKTTEEQSERPKVPWFNIVTSIPVWAFVLTHGASVFGYNTITNQLPTFMNYILNYKIKDNGILSSFPYIGKYIAAVIGGAIADKLLHSSRFSKNFVRKLLTFIGVFIPGCLMLFQIFVGNDKTFSIFVFTAALTANGVVVGGYLGNTLDIAPNFSGTVFGLGNMFSGLSGALSALLVGYLTDKNQVYRQWQKIFFIVAITYILGALTFLIFGSTEVQPWNHINDQKKKNEVKKTNNNEIQLIETRTKNSST